MRTEHIDVLIVGAGLSGIGAACHLKRECPDKTFVILESRDAIGGTWDLFRYPGIRSDSDMYTLGYNFKPWTDTDVIADGAAIREYIAETAAEHDINRHIRFGQRLLRASWSSETALWTGEVEVLATGEIVKYTCNFALSCTGYYNYANGYTPQFNGRERFKGQIIHPQHWPKDLDYTGKRVVIIGSGATAMTLVPSMAAKAAHVTMLQRSPTYVASIPKKDAASNILRRILPEQAVYRLARTRNVGFQMFVYQFSRTNPKTLRRILLTMAKKQLGKGFDMKHFTPHYNPWDERLCAVPNGDLFKAIRKGQASVVTNHIETFTEKGILLKSGAELEADIIVTATGLELQLGGGVQLLVDGQIMEPAGRMVYKGIMAEDIPNLGMVFGYTNASWTLKADLTSEYICRLLKHMDKTGTRQCTARNLDPSVKKVPFLNFNSGYVQRAAAITPSQGSKAPWKLYQNYVFDMATLRLGRVDDGVMAFSNPVKAQKKRSNVIAFAAA